MSVSSVSSSVASYVQKVTSGSSSSPSTSGIAASLQEATESQATTLKEAQNGDQVAKRKIAQQPAKAQQTVQPKTSEPGKGTKVDKDA